MRPRDQSCRLTQATKESDRANSLSECQSKLRRYDGLFAPTTAGACGRGRVISPVA